MGEFLRIFSTQRTQRARRGKGEMAVIAKDSVDVAKARAWIVASGPIAIAKTPLGASRESYLGDSSDSSRLLTVA